MDRCPQCGYTEKFQNKPMTNDMAEYVNTKNPKEIIVFNSRDERIKIGKPGEQVEYVRRDVKEKEDKAKASAPPTDPKKEIPPTK